jgi:ribonucleotide reductase alpha subunit
MSSFKKAEPMYVIKRDSLQEKLMIDKITNRIEKLLYGINDIDAASITLKICSRIFPGITTTELDNLASQVCMSMITDNPNYGILGSRIAISNHQKNTKTSFLEVLVDLKNNCNINGEPAPLISDELLKIVSENETEIQNMIDNERDYLFDFFGFKTLEKSYLLSININNQKKIVERPQHLFMRVAIGIHGNDLENVKKTYNNLSLKQYTHATPTLFNAGTPHPQLSSCFLIATEDSIEGIFETITDCAKISKWSGGIGIHISNIRANGSYIRKTGGYSDGILPMLKVYNDVARYINQGGGKRNGSFAVYLEPWHADIFEFLDAKKPHGSDEIRARDLFYALWVPDLFMEQVENDGDWYLMCPNQSKGLTDVYGEEFNKLYLQYVEEKKYIKKIKARELWNSIISSQIETGTPYMLYKDHVNKKSNQKNIGTIKSSNLCAEIVEYSGDDESAVCLTADTIIFTDKGLRKITECDNENILSFYNNDVDLVKNQQYIKAKLINNGIKEVFEIDLVGGFPIKATKNHKFLVVKNRNYNKKCNTYEWKTVEELTLKDRINRPKIEPLPNFENINIIKDLDTESLVVGWMIGDGWQRNYEDGHRYTYGVCFGSHEVYAQKTVLEQLNKIQINLEALKGGHNKKVSTYISKNGVVQWACSKESFAKYFIDNYGLEPKLGKNKIISEKINKLEPFKIASILSGLFSADGTVYRKTGKKNSFYVGLSSASKQLLIDVQLLLKCFGITSCLVFGEVKSRKRFQGKLTIENKDSIKLFYRYINFLLCPEKKQKLEDGILNHVYSRKIDEREWMSIKSIKNVGFENVYDLNIPNTHNFLANMVTVHNCNLASICLPAILDYSKSELQNPLFKYYFKGKLKLYSKDDCSYCKLLKALLKNCNLTYEEINCEKAEEYRLKCNPIPDKFETVPQLFSIYDDSIKYLGDYTTNWNVLKPTIDYNKLYQLSYDLTVNLNKVIDKNYYPTDKTYTSNMNHRPIGIGVQGLADLFIKLRLPFDSDEAREINKNLFETIYYGALNASSNLAYEHGKYSTFENSPLSKGLFQFNLWEDYSSTKVKLSGLWDWEYLSDKILKNGVRNSLLIALMPTASTSQIMGYNECFEPITSNLYLRRTLAGEFTVVNNYLMKDLIDLDLWNEDTKNRLIYDKGSVQNIRGLPKFLKDIYKTVWEIPQKSIIEMSADRGPFICQSQSLNLFFEKPEYKKLTMAHLLGWKKGLKTGSYYIRSKPALNAQKFGLDIDAEKKLISEDLQTEEEGCLSCGA